MYLIANWKENKTIDEAKDWLTIFNAGFSLSDKVKIIIAPTFVLLSTVKEKIPDGVFLSAQTVSKFESGSHTGETGAFQLKNLVHYTIISHSEREAVGETLTDAVAEIALAFKYQIKPIVCVGSSEEFFEFKKLLEENMFKSVLFAYEPIYAIGTGNPASTEDIEKFRNDTGLTQIIYGGSVDADNINTFLALDYINGFLVGSASLTAENFLSLYKKLCA